MRLQKYLQRSGVCSRREAAEYIHAGRVRVNGEEIREPGHPVAEQSCVVLDGRQIHLEEKKLYAIHKPTNVICSMKKQGSSTCIAELLEHIPERVVPIGRLDKDVSGLLLLTNDGDFSQAMAHPRNEVLRQYIAVCQVQTQYVQKAIELLRSGVELEDGPGQAKHAEQLEITQPYQKLFNGIEKNCILARMNVAEGRTHFVKRMFGTVGLPVVKLMRLGFGPYELGALAPGEIREEKFELIPTNG